MTSEVILLNRFIQSDESTVGVLRTLPGEYLGCVIEDGFNNPKIYGKTRIPPGMYPLKKRTYGGFYNRYKQRFGHSFVVEVQHVPNFTDILFHIGNFKEDTKGCLLVNEGFRVLESGDFAGYRSTGQYLKFYKFMTQMMKPGVQPYLNIIETLV